MSTIDTLIERVREVAGHLRCTQGGTVSDNLDCLREEVNCLFDDGPTQDEIDAINEEAAEAAAADAEAADYDV